MGSYGPKESLLDGSPYTPSDGAILRGKEQPIVKYRNALPWVPQKDGWTDQDAVSVEDSSGPNEPCMGMGNFREKTGGPL